MGGWQFDGLGVVDRFKQLRVDSSDNRDEIFELLSNYRRRQVILYCKDVEEATLAELAEAVAARELDKPVEEITSAERKRVYTALQQRHLPTLERAGMVEWDGRTVRLTEESQALEVYLDIVPADTIPWPVYYLGLAIIGVAVAFALWSGVIPGDVIPVYAWTAGIFAVIAGSALVHLVLTRTYRLDRMEER